MEIQEKIVEFNKYCNRCKNKDKNEGEDPCNICLDNSYTIYGKPINFVKQEIKDNKKSSLKNHII